ncbi:DUF4153 domain-containing protein [Plastorhodobacter daqingensis]|uniref:DUF4153 domain-containing protein n=1 Tax=Plastorhodobacter daqingensis TaxID=1387281 RepID=A0ABW2UEJ7_9RHOB
MQNVNRLNMRLILAATGTLAGLFFWLLNEVFQIRLGQGAAAVAAYVFGLVFFAALLVMLAPLGRRAVLPALGLAAGVAGLLAWASLRHDSPSRFFDLGYPGVAGFLLAAVPIPFLIAGHRRGEGWRNYAALFAHSWGIVARFAAGLLFVGLAWLTLWLSESLLQVAGVELIARLRALSGFPYILTGLTLGLALAVVDEYSDYVSAHLMLRLFRLLLPVVLVVVLVFVVALPLQGFRSLLPGVSVATTLLTMALVITLLVSCAVDGSDDGAVKTPLLRFSAQGLALLLPVLAALAVHALWLRVADEGWTPQRLMAAALAMVLCGYGASYALALLSRTHWMRRIRRANLIMALAIPVLAMLWLSPLFVPERIATQSQLARYDRGAVTAEALPLVQMRDNWGRSGRDGLAALAQRAEGGDAALATALAALPETPDGGLSQAEVLADLLRLMPVFPPQAQDVVRQILAEVHPAELGLWLQGCQIRSPAGHPGCALVVADFLPALPGEEALLIYGSRGGFVGQEAFGQLAQGGRIRLRAAGLGLEGQGLSLLDALHAGDYSVEPAEMNALRSPGVQIILTP